MGHPSDQRLRLSTWISTTARADDRCDHPPPQYPETMPQETELKLALRHDDLTRLLAHPLLNGQSPLRQRLLNTYFDTPKLTLMAQRIAVRERRIGRRTLLTVKTAGTSIGGLSQRGEWEGPTRPGAFDFMALGDDEAQARQLSGLAWQLVPVFRTDFTRRSWQLTHGMAQIEVALDQGWITTGDGQGPHREPILELELELLSGPVDALLDLAHTLALGPQGDAAHGLWLHPTDRSKAERGMALFMGQRLQPVKAAPVALTPEMQPVSAFQAAALNCLAHWQANVAGLLAAPGSDTLPDPEFVHQARVALRRLRTGLRLFGPALPRRFVAHWSVQWQASTQALGDARNWDVLATEGLPRLLGDTATDAATEALRHWVDTERHTANQRAQAFLCDPAHALQLLAFTRAVLALAPPDAHGRRSRPLTAWALRTLRSRHARLLREARHALRQGPEGRHALRIALKKLRYAQEFLASLLPPARLRRSTAVLTRAQELLGSLNDLSTAQALLDGAPQPARDTLLARMRTDLEAGLRALPRMERALLRTPMPWD
jgi:inorganic triphosphatase YgiF